jgi:hypothetical protein
VPGATGQTDSPAQPPITAPVVNGDGGGSKILQVMSTVRFSEGMASTQEQYTTFQVRVITRVLTWLQLGYLPVEILVVSESVIGHA